MSKIMKMASAGVAAIAAVTTGAAQVASSAAESIRQRPLVEQDAEFAPIHARQRELEKRHDDLTAEMQRIAAFKFPTYTISNKPAIDGKAWLGPIPILRDHKEVRGELNAAEKAMQDHWQNVWLPAKEKAEGRARQVYVERRRQILSSIDAGLAKLVEGLNAHEELLNDMDRDQVRPYGPGQPIGFYPPGFVADADGLHLSVPHLAKFLAGWRKLYAENQFESNLAA